MVLSTTAAGTISQTARGLSSFFTKSASEAAPTAFSLASSSTALRRHVEDDALVAALDAAAAPCSRPSGPVRSFRVAWLTPCARIVIASIVVAADLRRSLPAHAALRLKDIWMDRDPAGVELSIGLLRRQPLDQRPRKARHHAVIPPQRGCASARVYPPDSATTRTTLG